MALATSLVVLFYCCATADILTKLLQQCFLFFIVVVIPEQLSDERLQDHCSYSGLKVLITDAKYSVHIACIYIRTHNINTERCRIHMLYITYTNSVI